MGNSIYELVGDLLHEHPDFGYVAGCGACAQYDRDMAAIAQDPKVHADAASSLWVIP